MKRGPKPRISAEKLHTAFSTYMKGGITQEELAKELCVSPSTLYRYMRHAFDNGPAYGYTKEDYDRVRKFNTHERPDSEIREMFGLYKEGTLEKTGRASGLSKQRIKQILDNAAGKNIIEEDEYKSIRNRRTRQIYTTPADDCLMAVIYLDTDATHEEIGALWEFSAETARHRIIATIEHGLVDGATMIHYYTKARQR
ncbi:MAG: helix-turn-helix transcriptional regulator [Candidatus Aenigmarchaeota archaeon]|nr:helix-turn-helix transcriptional regulator [Candidatus Aenigmarchaeota archaeon]